MPLRRRISLAAAAAAAVAVAIAVILAFVFVRDQLRGQVDDELKAQATQILGEAGDLSSKQPLPGLAASDGGPAPYDQIVLPNGEPIARGGGVVLPDTKQIQAIASGASSAQLDDITVDGAHLRMYTFKLTGASVNGRISAAVQLARPLSAVDNVLSTLRLILGGLLLLAVLLAAVLARLAARRVLAPLSQVSATAQLIGETEDLDQRLDVHTDDEVGQLAHNFNAMLERLSASRDELDASVTAQRQLVADASHELRTPVTSLRTNIEVLLASDALDPDDRRRLLTDVVEQSEELTTLVSDLIEVARGDLPSEATEDIRLDVLVEEALARARRHAPDTEFSARLTPTAVGGNPERLSRAINNLLDNAARHTAPGTPVEVVVDEAGLRVRDHGGGIDPDDLPYIFDRFYRGANSRARQGSGLGLAIVRQVAERHQGSVSATNAPGGGALFTLRLPTVEIAPGDDEESFDPLDDGYHADDRLWSSSGARRTDPTLVLGDLEAPSQEDHTEQEDRDSGRQYEYPVTWYPHEDRD